MHAARSWPDARTGIGPRASSTAMARSVSSASGRQKAARSATTFPASHPSPAHEE